MSFHAKVRRLFDRCVDTRLCRAVVVGTLLVPAAAAAATPSARWQRAAPVPVARTEVAAASIGAAFVVVGGYLADGTTSGRVDVYDPGRRTWDRLPDLPVPVNHAAAAGPYRGAAYVVGGYTALREPSRDVITITRGSVQRLRAPAREPRAAAGAAIIGRRLYVAGGVGNTGLARRMLILDLETERWTTAPGPTPREHLAVATDGRRVYAVGGRLRGYDTNLRLVESWAPGERRWRREPPLPQARGGTGAAVRGRWLVSVGGEAPSGTLRRVYAFDLRARRWRRLPDLPTARHGLGVVRQDGRVYVVAGGPRPGLFVSGANEVLTLRP
jgi:Kelch motif/Galactose oxidase, central domain